MKEILIFQESRDHGLIPALVNLINLAHGRSATTEAVFRWKHFQSPFGHSLIIYMVAGDQIIGLRCCQFYRFTIGDRLIVAAQPCDTATHPDFGRQGVSRALLNRLLVLLSERKIDFIFNFPNNNSKPGYMAAGWKERKAQILLIPMPLLLLAPFFIFSGGKRNIVQISEAVWEQLGQKNISVSSCNDHVMRIEKDSLSAWIQWRFGQNPLNYYRAVKVKNVYFIGKLINRRIFTEFRIIEIIGDVRGVKGTDFLKKYPNIVPTFNLGEEHELLNTLQKNFLAKKHFLAFYVMKDLSGCFDKDDRVSWNLSGSWSDYA